MTAGITNVTSVKLFKDLVDNFRSTQIALRTQQSIPKASTHHANLVEFYIFHSKILGLILAEYQKDKFQKRDIDPKNIGNINKHLADDRERDMSEDEKPAGADDIKVEFPADKDVEVRNILRKHENIWPGQLREIKATELLIYLKQSTSNRTTIHSITPTGPARRQGNLNNWK